MKKYILIGGNPIDIISVDKVLNTNDKIHTLRKLGPGDKRIIGELKGNSEGAGYKGTLTFSSESKLFANQVHEGTFDENFLLQGMGHIKFNNSRYKGGVTDGIMNGKGVFHKQKSNGTLDIIMDGHFSIQKFTKGSIILPKYNLKVTSRSITSTADDYRLADPIIKSIDGTKAYNKYIEYISYVESKVISSEGMGINMLFYSFKDIIGAMDKIFRDDYENRVNLVYNACTNLVESSLDTLENVYKKGISKDVCSSTIVDIYSTKGNVESLIDKSKTEIEFIDENRDSILEKSAKYKNLINVVGDRGNVKKNPIEFEYQGIFKNFYAKRVYPLPIQIQLTPKIGAIEFLCYDDSYPFPKKTWKTLSSVAASVMAKSNEQFSMIVDTGNSAMTIITKDIYDFITSSAECSYGDQVPSSYIISGIGGVDSKNVKHCFLKFMMRFKDSPEMGIIEIDSLVMNYITKSKRGSVPYYNRGILFGLSDRNREPCGIHKMLADHNITISLK